MTDAMPKPATAGWRLCRGAHDGGVRYMGKEAIVFFDKLGFGWVVDSAVLKDVKLSILIEEDLPSRSLIQMIENILSEKHIS